MALELFINGTQSGAVGQINLYGDEPIQLNISVGDIRDISKKNSTFSQTFTIPADANNNILLNHIFNIGADSTFDPSKKTQCFILNDSISVFNGQFQLTKINVKNRNVISYECVVYGETIDLAKVLGNKLLVGNVNPDDDLDFSELNHTYTVDNIIASWTASTPSLGYYYPLIDYGYDLSLSELYSGILSLVLYSGITTGSSINTLTDTIQTWNTNSLIGLDITIVSGIGVGQTRTIISNTLTTVTVGVNWTINPNSSSKYHITQLDYTNPYSSTGNGLSPLIFKPAISNSYLFQKIISKAGFSVYGDFITSEEFTETILPFTGNVEDTLPTDYINEITFSAGLSGDWNQDLPPQFDNDSTDGMFDNGSLYDTTYPQGYTADRVTSQDFVVNVKYQYNIVATFPDICTVRFYRSSYTTGAFSTVNIPLGTVDTNVHTLQAISLKCDNVNSTVGLYPIQVGEKIRCVVSFTSGAVWNSSTHTYALHYANVLKSGTYWYNRVSPKLAVGGDLFFYKFIQKNVKQIDYIKSIITMFNLMVIPDKANPNRLKFIPRTDYYKNANIKDWTNKVDHTDKIEETLISEQQNRNIKLTYKSDKDFYNTDYTSKTNIIYGEHNEVINNEWIDGEKKIEVIFSPTPVDKVYGTDINTGIYLPKIAKRDAKSGIYSVTDANLRFLRKNPTLMSTSNTIQMQGKSPINFYPYAGHLDHPVNPTVDYNFGQIQFAYYPELTNMTENNLVETYWQQYLDDINDKNSKLIKCRIYLTPDDIAKFDYNDSIFIDGLTDDGGHYFNVNKITYIPTSNLPSIVELIKVNRKPTEKRRRYTLNIATMNPIRFVDIGKRNSSQSGGTFIIGEDNNIGYNAETTMVIGNNNTVANNANNVVIINSSNHNITESFTTIVGNSYFPQQGESYTLFNDIDSGLDMIINPFSNTILNDIDSGLDAVRNIGGQSIISDIDSGVDGTKI